MTTVAVRNPRGAEAVRCSELPTGARLWVGLVGEIDPGADGVIEVEPHSFTPCFAQPEWFLPAAVNAAAAGIPELQQPDAIARTEFVDATSELMEPRGAGYD